MKAKWVKDNLRRVRECHTYPGYGALTWRQRLNARLFWLKAAFLREHPDGTFGGLELLQPALLILVGLCMRVTRG